MKKLLLLVAIVALLPTSVCFGRIGETLDECIARYGPITRMASAVGKFDSEYPQYQFSFHGILVKIRFLNSRSAQEEFNSSYFMTAAIRNEIKDGNSKKFTGIDVAVDEKFFEGDGGRITITTKEFEKLIRDASGPGF